MPTDSTPQLVVFALRGEEYALGIEQVHEIIHYAEPRPIACSDPAVRGVISVRGMIVPLFDLAVRLGLDPTLVGEGTRVIVIDSGEEVVGAIVDQVREVIAVDAEGLASRGAVLIDAAWVGGGASSSTPAKVSAAVA